MGLKDLVCRSCRGRTPAIKYEDAPLSVSLPSRVLYVVLPYFNFCRFQTRKRLFLEFVERTKLLGLSVRIVVVEGALKGEGYDLPYPLLGTYAHLRVELRNALWAKENLINIAVAQLPPTWQAMAWIDADLTFLNEDWVSHTWQGLQKYDVLQLFQTAVYLGPDGEAQKTERSFAYMNAHSEHPYHPKSKYGQWHPGFAWAMTRKAYDQVGGLVDWAILGSGDRHMAMALIGKVDLSHPGNIHPGYARMLLGFQERAKGLRLGFVLGTILHHWHGSLANRHYVERWTILTRNGGYNPETDIAYTKNGMVHLTETGKRLECDIVEYFASRREDDKK